MKILAIIDDTIREGFVKKSIIAFLAVSTLWLILTALFAATSDFKEVFASMARPQNGEPLNYERLTQFVQMMLIGFLNLAILTVAVFATASIVPNTMESGSIDLLLSKPLKRHEIILGKFIGGVIIVFGNVLYYILGMWVILSLEMGYWNPGFLLTILPISFSFLVIFTMMMFFGVLSRSTPLTLILTYIYMIVFEPFFLAGRKQLAMLFKSEVLGKVLDGLYYVLPKPSALGDMASRLILNGPLDWEPVWTSALIAVALFAATVAVFRTKQF